MSWRIGAQMMPLVWRIMKASFSGVALDGRHDEVALVLAVVVVDDDDELAARRSRRSPPRRCPGSCVSLSRQSTSQPSPDRANSSAMRQIGRCAPAACGQTMARSALRAMNSVASPRRRLPIAQTNR